MTGDEFANIAAAVEEAITSHELGEEDVDDTLSAIFDAFYDSAGTAALRRRDARVLREAAEAWNRVHWEEVLRHAAQAQDRKINVGINVGMWLRERADQIEAGGESHG